MLGFQGIKHAVWIPKGKTLDFKLMQKIFGLLNRRMPNLMIRGMASTFHPARILDDAEIRNLHVQALCEENHANREATIREILALKLKTVVSALLAAAEQTKSATYSATAMCNTFDMLATMCLESGTTVDFFVGINPNEARVSLRRVFGCGFQFKAYL